jgi:hypothetical protein
LIGALVFMPPPSQKEIRALLYAAVQLFSRMVPIR